MVRDVGTGRSARRGREVAGLPGATRAALYHECRYKEVIVRGNKYFRALLVVVAFYILFRYFSPFY
jgi:hypothetical protein